MVILNVCIQYIGYNNRGVLFSQFRIFTAPFHHVGFADFWLADQLNSLTTVLLDLEYLICYYAIEVDWLPHGEKLDVKSLRQNLL